MRAAGPDEPPAPIRKVYFLALATDYDGTLAHGGVVAADTQEALRRIKETGRKLVLVTGRDLADLKSVCRDLAVFDRVVAENGALFYDPSTQTERTLAPPPPPIFVERLKERKVEPLSVGRVIVSTWEPEEKTVLEVIRDLGLELHIIFNKGAVMVLPAGITKAAGLAAALEELRLSPHNVVAVGDAENDHAFMAACGCSAAVANALPLVKAEADVVLGGRNGAGVIELTERLSADDSSLIPVARHGIPIGTDRDGEEVLLAPHAGCILIAGTSGIGKSTLATALTEQMARRRFAFCIFDPEGDYDDLEHAVVLGDATTAPQADEALKLLEQTDTSVVVNTQCFELPERPAFFAQLLPLIAATRARTGRPHWLLVDEAHHLLPARRDDLAVVLPDALSAVILITVHPEAVSPSALRTVRTIVALGTDPAGVVGAVCGAVGADPPAIPSSSDDEVVVWNVDASDSPRIVKPYHPRQVHKRHTRKYAEGKLGKDRSFYFRGPDNALNLRAHNLALFVEIAEGVDDATWEHHRRAHDYSTWFQEAIKDEALAREAAAIESDESLDARHSREAIAEAVRRRYTAPAAAEEP